MTRGELRWNVKTSFRTYVRAIEDGAETWLSDAGELRGNELVFVQDAANSEVDPADPSSGVIRYLGRVRFSGYRGMLMVNLADPWVELGTESLVLSIDASPPGTTPRRIDIATATPHAPVVRGTTLAWIHLPVVSTSAGAGLLGGVYREGEELDDLHFSVGSSM